MNRLFGLKGIRSRLKAWSIARKHHRYAAATPLPDSLNLDKQPQPGAWDLVTIAFNNPYVIRLQHQWLTKRIKDAFVYTVADNSNDQTARATIRAYCLQEGVPYLSLPPSPFKAPRYSDSHGAALNLVYNQYVLKRQASRIGLLDHDIFPLHELTLGDYLDGQPFYGMLQETPANVPGGQLRYLWPGLAFFESAFLKGKHIDFSPRCDGDTGSHCFDTLYKPILIDQGKTTVYRFAEEERRPLWPGEDFQRDMVAIIGGDWLHLVNASDWAGGGQTNRKLAELTSLLK